MKPRLCISFSPVTCKTGGSITSPPKLGLGQAALRKVCVLLMWALTYSSWEGCAVRDRLGLTLTKLFLSLLQCQCLKYFQIHILTSNQQKLKRSVACFFFLLNSYQKDESGSCCRQKNHGVTIFAKIQKNMNVFKTHVNITKHWISFLSQVRATERKPCKSVKV